METPDGLMQRDELGSGEWCLGLVVSLLRSWMCHVGPGEVIGRYSGLARAPGLPGLLAGDYGCAPSCQAASMFSPKTPVCHVSSSFWLSDDDEAGSDGWHWSWPSIRRIVVMRPVAGGFQ